ncbi:MAG TPA: hypothetical protein ENK02_07400 [Planctomycetes bacterium]|nr:hypothetical protein [Planctomycetota bacterium]
MGNHEKERLAGLPGALFHKEGFHSRMIPAIESSKPKGLVQVHLGLSSPALFSREGVQLPLKKIEELSRSLDELRGQVAGPAVHALYGLSQSAPNRAKSFENRVIGEFFGCFPSPDGSDLLFQFSDTSIGISTLPGGLFSLGCLRTLGTFRTLCGFLGAFFCCGHSFFSKTKKRNVPLLMELDDRQFRVLQAKEELSKNDENEMICPPE